jgi:heme-degrading monooxygenase HmoA
MFAYVLRARQIPDDGQSDEFFRRFTQTPGLLHAFDLRGVEDPDENLVVAVWESREAAERYLGGDPLRQEVDRAIPGITRTMYEVTGSK